MSSQAAKRAFCSCRRDFRCVRHAGHSLLLCEQHGVACEARVLVKQTSNPPPPPGATPVSGHTYAVRSDFSIHAAQKRWRQSFTTRVSFNTPGCKQERGEEQGEV